MADLSQWMNDVRIYAQWERTPSHRPGDPGRSTDGVVGVMTEDGRLVVVGRVWVTLSRAFKAGAGSLVFARLDSRSFTTKPGLGREGPWDLAGTVIMAMKDSSAAMIDVGRFLEPGASMPTLTIVEYEVPTVTEGTSNQGESR